MPVLFCASAATRGGTAVALLAATLSISSSSAAFLNLSDGSALQVDKELPGPTLNGTPTKLYSLSLGRVRRDHTASAEDATKLARRGWRGRRSLYLSFEDEPLFLGFGTHFAFVYVGTPPQRASVIVNTGSHFTAFPCAECRNCGNHTDPYWDPFKSSSAEIVSCDGGGHGSQCHGDYRCHTSDKRCVLKERYVEGSSWSAQQVKDQLWVGEATLEDAEKPEHDESAFSVDFTFGCIESLTGLFKTQLADGIMGMNSDSRTLISQLAEAGKIEERIFSLCFSEKGGTMVIGGYDPRLNKPGSEMQYTPSVRGSHPTVKVMDITLNGVSIAADASVFQSNRGFNVVSGTTDTYLPRAMAASFKDAWKAVTGSPYETCKAQDFCWVLTAELEDLPVITFHMDGGVEVNVRPEAYMDASPFRANAYAPRIYLTDAVGTLGANTMRDHNIVFDYDNHLVGFADGACDYHADSTGADGGSTGAEGGPSAGAPRVATATTSVEKEGEEDVDCVVLRTVGCDAECPADPSESSKGTVEGHETWEDVIVTPPQGSGKACLETTAEERPVCSKICP